MELHPPREPSSPQKEHHSSISFGNQTRSSAVRRPNSLVPHMRAPRNRREPSQHKLYSSESSDDTYNKHSLSAQTRNQDSKINILSTKPPAKRHQTSLRHQFDSDQLRILQATNNFSRRQDRPSIKPVTWMPAAEHINSKDFNVQSPPSTLNHHNYHYQSRYMPKFPISTGKAEEWDAFWMQFTACAKTLNLHGRDYATQLLHSLRGKAMEFAAELDMETV